MRAGRVYIARQIGFSVLVLWVIVSLSFFLRGLSGLQPLTQGDFGSGPPSGSGLSISAYLGYLGDVLHLDFGHSLAYPFGSVATLVATALPWTVLLVGIGTIIALTIGTVLGIILAWRRGSVLDTLVTPTVIFSASIPYYFVALILVYYVGLDSGWFPIADAYSPEFTPHLSPTFVVDVIQHGILPVTAVVAATFGLWVLPMRNAMVGVLDDDFMVLGRAKGLASRRLMMRYAARNVLLPVVTNFAVQLGYIMGGAVFVEVVFNYQGVGWLLVQSVGHGDYPTVQALILLAATVVLLTNLTVRLLYPRLDPRLRHE
ncbi:MAG TPA: peptide ABC transporter permease [Chloroflexi bacterium]|jgi:peptide/nickel transport system permease protein|nr:peptide ABC transporter permease [Chloroflexota bacterium]